MKYIIALFIVESLVAQSGFYAKIKTRNADLYKKPYECSKKKVKYFHKGDNVIIYSCDKYKWCKTNHGYVKKDFLILPQELKRKIKKPYIVKKQEIVEVYKPLQKVTSSTASSMTKGEKLTTESVQKLPHLNLSDNVVFGRTNRSSMKLLAKPVGEHENYFSGESSKLMYKAKK